MKEIGIAIILLAGAIGATYNYINVDGKPNTGKWLPLTSREIRFTASAGTFEGNRLFIEKDLPKDSITIKAVLRADTTIFKERIIYIKKKMNRGQ